VNVPQTENELDPQISVFHNDDDGYRAWVRRTNGYVLTERAAGEFMLHDCECSHLTLSDTTLRLTASPRRCAAATRPLREWTVRETGAEPLRCQTCM
jgi:hypothetical protein